MLMNVTVTVVVIIIVIVVTWSALQCALEAREGEREDALQRTLAPARDPDRCAFGGRYNHDCDDGDPDDVEDNIKEGMSYRKHYL